MKFLGNSIGEINVALSNATGLNGVARAGGSERSFLAGGVGVLGLSQTLPATGGRGGGGGTETGECEGITRGGGGGGGGFGIALG